MLPDTDIPCYGKLCLKDIVAKELKDKKKDLSQRY